MSETLPAAIQALVENGQLECECGSREFVYLDGPPQVYSQHGLEGCYDDSAVVMCIRCRRVISSELAGKFYKADT